MIKLHRIAVLSGAVVLAQAAIAGDIAPDAKTLAVAEGMAAYCAKADPEDASKYQEMVKLVVQGASDEKLATVRKSDAYRQAHGSVDDFVAKVDPHNAKKFCTESPVQAK